MATTDVKIFKNEQFGSVRVADVDGEPVFCLADICTVIGIKDTSRCASRLDDDVRLTHPIQDSLGRVQNATFVTEGGLYDVIIRSDSDKAKPFRKWITNEVLPSIRKHGAYMTADTLEKALTSPDFLIQLATQLKAEQQQRIIAEAKLKDQAPKVLFANAIVAADNSILIGRLANVLKQNGVDIGQNRLFKWLRENGYLCKAGERYNQPTQVAMEKGLFEVSYNTVVRADKCIQTVTTKVTGKGQMYFVNKFLNA